MQETTSNFSFVARILLYIIIVTIFTLSDTIPPKFEKNLYDVSMEYRNLFLLHKDAVLKYLSYTADREREFKRLIKKKDVSRNFASVSSGSRIVEKNRNIEQASAILQDNDKSMLFPCYLTKTNNIFFIIDLSEDFYMKEFIMVSKSFFSNYIASFTIETSIDYVSEGWTKHGAFYNNEDNIANLFALDNYYLVRFMKVTILSNHEDTNNYYCSINQLKVYGKTITYSTKVWKEKLLKDKEDNKFIENIEWEDSENLSTTAPYKFPSAMFNNYTYKMSPIKNFLELLLHEEPKENNGEDPYQEIYQFFSDKINYLNKHLNELKNYVRRNEDFDPWRLSDTEKGFLFYQLLENKNIEHNFDNLNKKIEKVQGLENKIYTLTRRFHLLQKNIEHVSQNIYSSYTKIDTVSKRYSTLKNEIEGLNWRLTALQNSYDNMIKIFLVLFGVIITSLVVLTLIKGRSIVPNKTKTTFV